jgi:dTDP-glucose pyrophosphorylase
VIEKKPLQIGKAVVMARGLGTRMRAGDDSSLTQNQSIVASTGVKSLVPIVGEKTLLDFIVERLISAGFANICLVIGPEHSQIRDHCRKISTDLEFAIQVEPKGTADAILAAEDFVGEDRFLAINSDNLYPLEALTELKKLDRQGMVAFDRKQLIENSNIPEERLSSFADVITEGEFLRRIVEKPEVPLKDGLVSMNLWMFEPSIFRACREIEPSIRGEYEITAAVNHSINEMGEKFNVIPSSGAVLDLSSKADISKVGRILTKD